MYLMLLSRSPGESPPARGYVQSARYIALQAVVIQALRTNLSTTCTLIRKFVCDIHNIDYLIEILV